jgi:hypothetical protein
MNELTYIPTERDIKELHYMLSKPQEQLISTKLAVKSQSEEVEVKEKLLSKS